MDTSFCSPLQLQDDYFMFESLLDKSLAPDWASDPGYCSGGSSLSPTSSVDSFCFSPASLQLAGHQQDALDSFLFPSPAEPQAACQNQNQNETPLCPELSPAATATTATARKSRSRYPGKKRQTASEREKLRMRDLTKSMHHLRSYLPPSVAPAGQSLTKIETLRLTIRYISYLSAQLGLSDEALEQRKQVQTPGHLPPQPEAPYAPQTSSYAPQTSGCYSPQTSGCYAPQTSGCYSPQTLGCYSPQTPGCYAPQTSSMEHLPSLQHPYQMSAGLCLSSEPEQSWTPQQQTHTFTFPGRC
ncbi:mesoderm posterior protein 1-like [Cololabis saira]|uniref:mesoderm posterior protein 1-like n=1 Tax=Cololabis saira TaxID=129043 RepID=UPI002AD29BC6|nr:mesoderm posterior protein 1-like [Cololabis saira]